jgi:hypothetical protein
MSFGIVIRDHLGTVIESADAITSATDSRIIYPGTSGTYTVPASTRIISMRITEGMDMSSAVLTNSTTVSYSSPSSAGTTLVITFL